MNETKSITFKRCIILWKGGYFEEEPINLSLLINIHLG